MNLSSLENELFLSYCHLDDASVIEGQPGWVSRFLRILKIRLGVHLGRRPKVWWDRPELRGNDDFAEQIIEGLSSVAAPIPILSQVKT